MRGLSETFWKETGAVAEKEGHSCTYCLSLLTIMLRKNTSNRLVFIQRAASTQGLL